MVTLTPIQFDILGLLPTPSVVQTFTFVMKYACTADLTLGTLTSPSISNYDNAAPQTLSGFEGYTHTGDDATVTLWAVSGATVAPYFEFPPLTYTNAGVDQTLNCPVTYTLDASTVEYDTL